MKRKINKTITSMFIALSLAMSGTSAVAMAETGPARGAEPLDTGIGTGGPSVPGSAASGASAAGSAASGSTNAATSASANASLIASSPFNTNVYGSPVNGYYCDGVTTYTYENLESDISVLVSEFGSVVKSSVLGVSADNRNIYELPCMEESTSQLSSLCVRFMICFPWLKTAEDLKVRAWPPFFRPPAFM